MMTDNYVIRPQLQSSMEDYKAIAALYSYAYPGESVTATSLKLADSGLTVDFVCKRWIAEQNGIVRGVGCFEHWEAYFHPDKYLLHIIVDPNYQNRGLGSALYHAVMEDLEKRQPQFVRTWVQKDRVASVSFAEHRGFTKIKLKWNIRLNLKSWSIEPFTEQFEAICKQGIEIKSLSEMNKDSQHLPKLYDLYGMTLTSIEAADTANIPSFDEFTDKINQSSDELFFVAIDNNRYVGMWQLENDSVNSLYGGIMAVDAAYRRRGTALALAVRGIAQAKYFQYKTLTVHTDEHNQAILALTEKMGFTHLPAQIFYSKQYAV
jgi:ribosomal protein S18 acetylase RimI-like enzyme